jgi:hypothetical protein
LHRGAYLTPAGYIPINALLVIHSRFVRDSKADTFP